MGEIQDFKRGRKRRRSRGGWLSRPWHILLLPFVALTGLGLYLATSPSLSTLGPAPGVQFTFTADRDCRDFATRWEAQWFYWQAGRGDPHRLDEDGDGLACEFNPWVDLSGWFGR